MDDVAVRALTVINRVRGRDGLRAYVHDDALARCGSKHNLAMAAGGGPGGLSHQCPGEPDLATRATAAGVRWTAVGENVGVGGPVPRAFAKIVTMVLALNQGMLDEKPPEDGHRRNLLSTAFTHVGIAVYHDAAGMVWITQDFCRR